eukprot:scaffold7029_cov375-Pinguiococcus_pyrenoidosus.AAC.3
MRSFSSSKTAWHRSGKSVLPLGTGCVGGETPMLKVDDGPGLSGSSPVSSSAIKSLERRVPEPGQRPLRTTCLSARNALEYSSGASSRSLPDRCAFSKLGEGERCRRTAFQN